MPPKKKSAKKTGKKRVGRVHLTTKVCEALCRQAGYTANTAKTLVIPAHIVKKPPKIDWKAVRVKFHNKKADAMCITPAEWALIRRLVEAQLKAK